MREPSAPTIPDKAPTPVPDATSQAVLGTPIGPERLRRLTWWSTVGLVYGVGAYLVIAILLTEPVVAVALVAAVGAALGCGASARLLERRLPGAAPSDTSSDGRIPRHLVAVAVIGAVAVLAAAQFAGATAGPVTLGVAAAAVAAWVSPRRRSTVVAGGALLTMAVATATRYAVSMEVVRASLANQALAALVIGGGLTVVLWFWDLVHRLERARRIQGDLAVADERLRFAADLHDIQGHHLQVIALEAELATRLAATDPGAAAEHMRAVHEHARTALADTRGVVQGYRRTSLGAELANATRVLAAAGIDGRLEHGTEDAADAVPEPGRHLFGLAVREATTNVLRHSHAARARIGLEVGADEARLTMRNDGAAAPDDPSGGGLATLAARLDSSGGSLEWGHEDDWFTVTARVPVGAGGGA